MIGGNGTCSDLFPTLVNLVDAHIPEHHPVDGQDLSRLLSGQAKPNHRNEFLNHYPHPRRGQSHFFTTWRKGDWKVIYEYMEQGKGRYSLYNLAVDPSESTNLAAENPQKLRRMVKEMVHELESRKAIYPVKNSEALKPVIPMEKSR